MYASLDPCDLKKKRLTKFSVMVRIKIGLALRFGANPVECLHIFDQVFDLVDGVARVAVAFVLLRC